MTLNKSQIRHLFHDSPLAPRLRFIHQTDHNIALAFEFPPTTRTILVRSDLDQAFRLCFPYQIFCVSVIGLKGHFILKNMSFGLRNHPLTSPNDPIGGTRFLPNTDATSHTCLGQNIIVGLTIHQLAQDAIETFWSAPFSTSVTRHYDPRLRTFNAWAEATKKTPNFINTILWT